MQAGRRNNDGRKEEGRIWEKARKQALKHVLVMEAEPELFI
jgi:hypothetical protein